jgi:hypothetical protein
METVNLSFRYAEQDFEHLLAQNISKVVDPTK